MFTLYKLLRSLLRSLASDAAPWQMAVGAFLGVLLGLLPIWPAAHGPSPLGLCLVLALCVVNCHIATALLFLGIGKLVAGLLAGPAATIGGMFDGLARSSAEIPFLHLSLWSHTGWLGLTLVGLVLAPLAALGMWLLATWFRRAVVPRLQERKRLLAAGQKLDKPWLVNLGCWFLGV